MSISSSSDSEQGLAAKKFDDFDFFDSDNNETSSKVKEPNSKAISTNEKTESIKEISASYQRTSIERKTPVISDSNEIHGNGLKKSNIKSKEKPMGQLTIHMPTESFSENEDSSGSSVTDVSPLQSPDATPRPKSAARTAYRPPRKSSLTKAKGSNISNKTIRDWPRAQRSKGETLSISDLKYASDSNSISSSDKEGDHGKRKKVLRKKKVDYDDLHHRMESSTRHHRRRLLDVAAQNSMDISQLLEVVLEMEQEENMRKALSRPDYPKYLCHIQPPRRKNMSFSRERARDIDIENERLSYRLTNVHNNSKLRRPSSASSVRSSASSCRTTSTTRSTRRPATAMGPRVRSSQGPRLYHSATNRIRDQQRIERENLAILKRLQGTRASNSLRRDTLLHDYERQTGKSAHTIGQPRSMTRSTRYTEKMDQKGKPSWQESW